MSNLQNAGHQAVVKAFADKLRASDGAAYVWFNKGDCMWHVSAETPDGLFNLVTPDGAGWKLETLLHVLAGEGVTSIKVEFDGVSKLYYDRLN